MAIKYVSTPCLFFICVKKIKEIIYGNNSEYFVQLSNVFSLLYYKNYIQFIFSLFFFFPKYSLKTTFLLYYNEPALLISLEWLLGLPSWLEKHRTGDPNTLTVPKHLTNAVQKSLKTL